LARVIAGAQDEAQPLVERAAAAAAEESLAFEVALMELCRAVLAGAPDGAESLRRLGIRPHRIAVMRAALEGQRAGSVSSGA
jgi:hypothetical protein